MSSEPPNQWEAILDYSKGVVALALALLSVTVTFADKVLIDGSEGLKLGLVIASWSLLLGTIIFGVVASVFTIQYLRNGSSQGVAVLGVNVSFFALAAAGVTFLWLGIVRVRNTPSMDLDRAVLVARSALASSTQVGNTEWQVLSGKCGNDARCSLTFITATGLRYDVTINPAGRVEALHRTSP
jgi:hypothetical protein